MKVVILSGLISSGKTTLGKKLVEEFNKQSKTAEFIDIDDEVEKLNPQFKWDNPQDQIKDWLKARKTVAEKTNLSSEKETITVVVGPFFKYDEISGFVKYLSTGAEVFLYNLLVSLQVRLERNRLRQWPNPDEDMKVQTKQFEELKKHFGKDINNTYSPEHAIHEVLKLIGENIGTIDIVEFN